MDINKIKKAVVIDFDKTLINTIEPEQGKIIWKEKTGKDYPHRGWWSKRETLDIDVFDNDFYPDMAEVYNKAISEPNTYISLCTGRISPLKKQVETILDKHNFKFQDVVLNGDKRFQVKGRNETLGYKIRYFASVINMFPNLEELVIYDDRIEHHDTFVDWGDSRDIKVTVNLVKR